ncbi:MAG: dihydroorotate dehydrogenase, partial [Chloroflexi bacterium]|nr:dihydroorotate dehydrogenase [Chloroflexota bacterium]
TVLPVIAKLEHLPGHVAAALAVEAAGADAVATGGPPPAMRVDVARAEAFAGVLSGPAILPLALRRTHDVAQAVRIPVIGGGGVTSAAEAIEFLMAGASAVQVGSAALTDPRAPLAIVEGLAAFVRERMLESIRDVIGVALPPRDDDDEVPVHSRPR